ncbi:hypothetical protein SAMN05892877_1158 [Rhizobium subbaraonis]|uniref:Uncharacterized protein n=2 Tax=Rhizobium subbaraonis TaxID=908946 RepID=A0A285UU39_9HYPH|nr:hypothetical protein SAMN05892877_1158 [Rhizobium subbaraonis]
MLLRAVVSRYRWGMEDDEKTGVGKPAAAANGTGAKARESEAVRARADERKARLSKTLRDNLARRKQQARARRAGAADDTDGLPAAKSDESDV